MNRLIDRYAVVFVAIAATLWAADAYFRNQLVQHLSATQIVVAEDALVTLFLLPVLIRSRHELRLLGARGWTAVGISRRRAGAGHHPVHGVVLDSRPASARSRRRSSSSKRSP
jgi:hypothetical protein